MLATLTQTSTVREPIPAGSRLLAIDVARGFALLGIFLVNIQFFAEPFGSYMRPTPESSDALTIFCFYFVKIFCEGKFYPLFSMLFGMGLALQMQSVMSRGGGFYFLYTRRLAWLFFMGLTHALLLWYGDILFIYSIAGLVLMLALSLRIRPHALLATGIAIVLLSAIVLGLFTAATTWSQSVQPAPAAASVPAEVRATSESDGASGKSEAEVHAQPKEPFWRLIEGFQSGQVTQPDTGVWPETETEAYRQGPWSQSFLFRAMSWGMILIFGLFGFHWHVLGMFLIGAALLKLGLFSPQGERWQTRLCLVGLLIALPGVAIGAILPGATGNAWYAAAIAIMLQMVCGPLVSLMYLCMFALTVRHGRAAWATGILSNVGRMALTNYLTQTIVSTFVFYHWGFAQFGTWTRPERCAFVIGVYACQCVISVLWMRTFRFGPAEWLWRTMTYLKPQQLLRSRDDRGCE